MAARSLNGAGFQRLERVITRCHDQHSSVHRLWYGLFTLVGYARVSTEDQSTAAQLPALRDAGCSKIYEEAVSGRTMERPELERCLNHLEPGDTLTVWRLDRLGRSLRDLLEIISRLEKHGVHFASLKEKFDTSTAAGRLIFHVSRL